MNEVSDPYPIWRYSPAFNAMIRSAPEEMDDLATRPFPATTEMIGLAGFDPVCTNCFSDGMEYAVFNSY